MIIKSAQNRMAKRYAELVEKRRSRKKFGMLAVEGAQEIGYALRGGYQLEYLLFPEGSMVDKTLLQQAKHFAEVDQRLFEKITYRGLNSGIAAIMDAVEYRVDGRRWNKVLVLENIEKPGNLGALFRTALASGCEAIITTGSSTDFYNPNCIRSSVGTVFLLPHWHMENEAALAWLQAQQLPVCITDLTGSQSLYEGSLPERVAFVFGAEHQGVSDFWRNHSQQRLRIPMQGNIDSLNLSASAAVVLYEHYRKFGS